MKENISLEKLNRRIDEVICRSLLLAFNKKFKYEYDMPRGYFIVERLIEKLSSLEICETLKEKINKVIDRDYGESSILEHFMDTADNIVRNEWFYGWGDVYTWRQRQKSVSIKLIKEFLSEEEQKDINKVWKVLKLHNLKYNENPYWWID